MNMAFGQLPIAANRPLSSLSGSGAALIDDQQTVRLILNELSGTVTNPLQAMVYGKLAKDEFHLAASYMFSQRSLNRGDWDWQYNRALARTWMAKFPVPAQVCTNEHEKYRLYSQLADALVKDYPKQHSIDNSIYVKLSSGDEHFGLMQEAPNYWVKTADKVIIRDHAHLIGPLLHKKVWVDIGCGDGSSLVFMLERIRECGYAPDAYILIDRSARMLALAKKELINAGIDAHKIQCICADFNSKHCWQNPVIKDLNASGHDAFVTMTGGTIHDLNKKEISSFLQFVIESFRPRTLLGVTVDLTRDPETIERGYVTDLSKEFVLKGAVESLNIINVKVDPSKLDCQLSVKSSLAKTAVALWPITCPSFHIHLPATTLLYQPSENGMSAGEITKFREKEIYNIFVKNNGLVWENSFPYRGEEIFAHVAQALWLSRTPGG